MSVLHAVATACLVIAGACFLLTAFGTGSLGGLGLEPIGLLFFVIGVAVYHHAHYARVP